jgi:CAAX prenyl protease-like protein
MRRSSRPDAIASAPRAASTDDAAGRGERRSEARLAVVVGTALVVQMFVRYWGQLDPALRWGEFFYATAASRLLVFAVGIGLGLSLRQLGVATAPTLRRGEGKALLVAVLVVTLLALPLLGIESYRAAYAGLGVGDGRERWLRWALFTASTTLSWELCYRGFLLFGVREILRPTVGGFADGIAILFTLCFEVLAHLIKPPTEALAMLVGSPALSWLALRHGSVWIALLVHVWIEFLWFVSVWH